MIKTMLIAALFALGSGDLSLSDIILPAILYKNPSTVIL